MAPILIYATLLIPTNILFEAALSFLGVGVAAADRRHLGRHALRRGALLHAAALHVLARHGDLHHRAGLQPVRRRTARRARPEGRGDRRPELHSRHPTDRNEGSIRDEEKDGGRGRGRRRARPESRCLRWRRRHDDANTDGDAAPEFNAAIDKVFNPSDKKGGTLKIAISADWDSVDPGDTYYGLSWNLLRLYGRSLTMFKAAPGKAQQRAGRATSPRASARRATAARPGPTSCAPGLKFEDGTPITSKDVKYARRARSIDKARAGQRPDLLRRLPRPARATRVRTRPRAWTPRRSRPRTT